MVRAMVGKIPVCLLMVFMFCSSAWAQPLKPGFDIDEYLAVLQRSAQQVDKAFRGGQSPVANTFTRVYRSPEQGLHNKYDIWESPDKSTIAINLRGTTSDRDSWLENLYSAMIPATGSLTLSDKYTFKYRFAADARAAVHCGWAIGVAAIAPDVVDKIKRYYAKGVRQVIIEGHSQGGVLSFLLTSYLHYLSLDGGLPPGIVFKTYCSAAPKPGNLYYAYDFDYITRGGWAFNIVNAADWVPENPFSLQTLNDMSETNPFVHTTELMKKQKLPVRLYVGHMYRSMKRSSDKAQRRFEKYLGKRMYPQVRKYIPGYQQPVYVHSGNYQRAGNPIVLQPDSEYYKTFPDTGINVFRHHLFAPYDYLARKTYK